MNIIEKVKSVFSNFDLSSAYVSLTSTITATFTEGISSVLYLGISVVSFYYTFKIQVKKADIEHSKSLIEIDKAKLELKKLEKDLEKQSNDCDCETCTKD